MEESLSISRQHHSGKLLVVSFQTRGKRWWPVIVTKRSEAIFVSGLRVSLHKDHIGMKVHYGFAGGLE